MFDVRTTLKHACKKVFADASASMEQRLKRAQAIRVIGSQFMSIGKAVGETKNEEDVTAEWIDSMEARAKAAIFITMTKDKGREVTEDDAEESMRQYAQMAAARDASTDNAGENSGGDDTSEIA